MNNCQPNCEFTQTCDFEQTGCCLKHFKLSKGDFCLENVGPKVCLMFESESSGMICDDSKTCEFTHYCGYKDMRFCPKIRN